MARRKILVPALLLGVAAVAALQFLAATFVAPTPPALTQRAGPVGSAVALQARGGAR
eukprot:CAMPEP_0170612012 /NCGR_PEP_ID=MMETSP0224-20130122/23494_1 /TAXON_ID=285029 /ORGANISM="Togula jolla, Strain CCCM 725" /LENGTH=56 /DNA_ID=CAMNT_0010937483 /DNA_START=50 /DNA_END=216 /DNA_ORIENTATION=+